MPVADIRSSPFRASFEYSKIYKQLSKFDKKIEPTMLNVLITCTSHTSTGTCAVRDPLFDKVNILDNMNTYLFLILAIRPEFNSVLVWLY